MNFLNKFLISLITFQLLCLPAFCAIDIDATVDYEIRRKYNPNKIEEDLLPPLPDKLKNDVKLTPKDNFGQSNQKTSPKTTNTNTLKEAKIQHSQGQTITLKRGTKFTLRNTSAISDKMSVGAKVYFKLPKPIKPKYFYLPENTRFVGVITDVHTPQLTGNGGLIVIRIEKVIINGKTQEISGKITKANYKKIFFNNIKGKRKFWANLVLSITPGKNFNNKTWKVTKKLANDGITIIFSPFTMVGGLFVFGVNIMASPVIAIFSKGSSISLPADTAFQIKLTEDVTIYN